MDAHWHRLLELLYFLAPAYAANMVPPFTRWLSWNPPIHERLLGSHKTVLGFAAGVLAGIAVAALQAGLGPARMALIDYSWWPLVGFGLGFGAMAGDSLKSLLKRRIGIAPGRPWFPFDQVDFVLGALLLVAPFARIGWFDALLLVAFTALATPLVSRAAYMVGIKRDPW